MNYTNFKRWLEDSGYFLGDTFEVSGKKSADGRLAVVDVGKTVRVRIDYHLNDPAQLAEALELRERVVALGIDFSDHPDLAKVKAGVDKSSRLFSELQVKLADTQ